MNVNLRDERETLCPRCGADAERSFTDPGKTRVEVVCPDCGRYTMSREEFDQSAMERSEILDPEARG